MSRIAAVPITGKVLRFVFLPPRWEVVQLVGLQTLDLAILVRVQASQPNHLLCIGMQVDPGGVALGRFEGCGDEAHSVYAVFNRRDEH